MGKMEIPMSYFHIILLRVTGKAVTEFVTSTLMKLHLFSLYLKLEPYLVRFVIPWEKNTANFVAHLKGNVFVDAGACYGLYSYMLRKNFKHIVALEPNNKNFEIIRQRAIRNVNVISFGLSGKTGNRKLYLNNMSSGGHSIIDDFNGFRDYVEIATVSLNDWLPKLAYIIDLIKLDVEGAEIEVLQGADKVYHLVKSWIIELHELERRTELLSILHGYGYLTHWFDERHLYAWN